MWHGDGDKRGRKSDEKCGFSIKHPKYSLIGLVVRSTVNSVGERVSLLPSKQFFGVRVPVRVFF